MEEIRAHDLIYNDVKQGRQKTHGISPPAMPIHWVFPSSLISPRKYDKPKPNKRKNAKTDPRIVPEVVNPVVKPPLCAAPIRAAYDVG